MSSYKERWFADFERRVGDYEDRGMDADMAYERAAEDAYDALTPEDIETLAEEAAWRRERDK